jgi:hypothetical protein
MCGDLPPVPLSLNFIQRNYFIFAFKSTAYSELEFKFVCYICSNIAMSDCLSRAIKCENGSVEGLFVTRNKKYELQKFYL